MKQLIHSLVSVGQDLPELALSVTTSDVVAGALASRDYSPLHHDYHYATEQAGHRNIFLNTPHQAALFERYLSDWSGPRGRLGRMRFSMKSSVYAGEQIRVCGKVVDKSVDDLGCGWLILKLQILLGEVCATECQVRYALPLAASDNPWMRNSTEWQP